MPIVVSCACGQRFAAKDELAGRTVKCPKCAAPLQIKANSTPAKAAVAAAPEASGVGDILDEIGLKAGDQGSPCPKCAQGVIKPGTVVCSRCGYNLQTGSLPTLREEKSPAAEGQKYDWKRLRESNTGAPIVAQDEDLSGGELALCIFCSVIATVYGIVLFAQARPKGLKIIMLSFILPLLLLVVRLLMGTMMATPDAKKDAQSQLRAPATAARTMDV
jgi:hypothetical protein